jgi:hypothetical protein
MPASSGSNALVEASLRQTSADMDWLLTCPALDRSRQIELIRFLLTGANSLQLRSMLADPITLTKTIALLNPGHGSDTDLLACIARNVTMPSRDYVTLVVALLPSLKVGIDTELIGKAIELVLPQEPSEVSSSVLDRLLLAAGDKLNGGRTMIHGLQRGVSSAAASRNLVAFGRAPTAARNPILAGVEEMARALTGRNQLDISTGAAEAAANLLWESETATANGFIRASAILLPLALDDRREASSPLIAAAFPPVYRELAKDRAVDLLSLMFVFLDWDKCKSARRRLSDAFVHSEWRISDIAIAAVRAGDAVRILGTIARERSGEKVLRDLGTDLKQLPEEIRKPIRVALKKLGLN